MARKKFPIGIQTFSEIRNNNYVYVDKTDLVYKLVSEGKVYFLSRPRRFGKSLLISTLEQYFLGKKEMFEGLKIAELEREWKEYPVIRLDFNAASFTSVEVLQDKLNLFLTDLEEIYGSRAVEKTLSDRFGGVIKRASQQAGRGVVVLVDEYDKPLLQSIANEELSDQFRDLLKAFYGVLKSSDEYLKFVLLTGVTKFSKVSIFSDLNQLQDISLDSEYAALCGITEEELEDTFSEDIKMLAEKEGVSGSEMMETLRLRYDGYHFGEDAVGVYNPFSVLNVFAKLSLRDYWFQTGTPTFLMELLKQSHYDIADLEGVRMDANDISNYRADSNNPVPIIYQAGYLTIKGYNEFEEYILGYPNMEVKRGFLRFIAPSYVPPITETEFSIPEFVRDLRANDVNGFMTRLQSFIAAMDYELFDDKLKEKYFQTIFYLIFRLAGSYITVEQHTSKGRIDAVVQTSSHIYIFEFKLDKTVEEALAQIEERRYADRYLSDPRQIVKIGANFSTATHQLEGWKIVG